MKRQAPLRAVEQEEPPASERTGGGNGGAVEGRLRQLEIQLAEIKTKLDGELKHLATKAWVLGGVVAGMSLAAAIAATIAMAVLRAP